MAEDDDPGPLLAVSVRLLQVRPQPLILSSDLRPAVLRVVVELGVEEHYVVGADVH